MFTGLVQGVGVLKGIKVDANSAEIAIQLPANFENIQKGESISVNGVCLTVTKNQKDAQLVSMDIMGVTLAASNIGDLEIGNAVNLERAMLIGDRFGGHIVQGHIDGTTKLVSRELSDNWETFRFEILHHLRVYFVPKGSVCLNGVSLTISNITDDGFEVSLIPTTMELTNLAQLRIGDKVNIEVDVIAKYVQALLENRNI
jgi:riboflavin synthase